VTVEHGRHPARATDAAGGAFAEFLTGFGGDLDLGHGSFSSSDACDAKPGVVPGG
jgi:hypothetical protein